MSLLEFERRVLEEAGDERNPLLERVKFLGILGRNLDEFLMVRGRAWMVSPAAQRLVRKTQALLRNGYRLLRRDLLPALATAGLHILDYSDLSPAECANVDDHFIDAVLPRITPTICDDGSIADVPGLGLNFVVELDREVLAIVRLPEQLSSLVAVEIGDDRPGHLAAGEWQRRKEAFVWLSQVVAANLHRVFPGVRIGSAHAFRIIRDADIMLEPAAAEELPLRTIAAVRQRESNPIVMMVIERAAPARLIHRLARAVSVPPPAVVRTREVLDLSRLCELSPLPHAHLRYPPFVPCTPARTRSCMFASIRDGDILLHHPFESFRPVIDLVRQAAADSAVEAISATLYRTDRGNSPVIDALIDAARRGKRVRVVVELKARFDERINAEWARALHAAGAQVLHAPAGLKVHAKMLAIARREDRRLRRYAHVSSGNYSSFTSMVYTDLALLTCDESITADIEELFEFIAGATQTPATVSLLAAPFALRAGLRALVEREIRWAQRGEAAHIIMKMNALNDQAAVELLQRASQAGVQVDLVVRGACLLRPGVPGVSDRIRVRSIVGRFLEHSRVWSFRNGGADEIFIGSADLRPRNFDRRVEIVVPVKDRALARRIRYEILDTYLSDTLSARELLATGRYRRLVPRFGEPGIAAQSCFLDLPQTDQANPRSRWIDPNRRDALEGAGQVVS
jgi:polyphosphate kinase